MTVLAWPPPGQTSMSGAASSAGLDVAGVGTETCRRQAPRRASFPLQKSHLDAIRHVKQRRRRRWNSSSLSAAT